MKPKNFINNNKHAITRRNEKHYFQFNSERIINRDKELKRVFTLFETYFKFTNITDFKNKYNIIKSVINNKILTEQEREKLFDIIRENQKLYLIICKLIHKYKFIKSKKFDNDFDLHGESLSCMPATQKITIYQENTRYEFKLTDIVNIIKHSFVNVIHSLSSQRILKIHIQTFLLTNLLYTIFILD